MNDISDVSRSVLRSIISACQTPVIILLLLAAVLVIILLGSLLGEWISEHRHFKVFLPRFMDDLKACDTTDQAQNVVKDSGLLLRQKRSLLELMRHPSFTPEQRSSLAASLDYQEQRRYTRITKVSDLLSRIAPMLGLLGTLIPLGPGIQAMGNGEFEILSSSLLTAFDTTSMGLIIAAFALIISAIRKRWYKDYMVAYEAGMEFILDMQKGEE